MPKLVWIAVIVLILAVPTATSTQASTHPIGDCPDQFALHPAPDHDDHHGHQHVGTATDRNGDGWICAKHISADGHIHVHTDNNRPLS
jgi:hypothetical protein